MAKTNQNKTYRYPATTEPDQQTKKWKQRFKFEVLKSAKIRDIYPFLDKQRAGDGTGRAGLKGGCGAYSPGNPQNRVVPQSVLKSLSMEFSKKYPFGFKFKIKSNLHYTRRIAPKRVTSCGAHLRGLAPGLLSSEETSQRWRAVGDTVPI